ncbi:hypothetical protein H9P43_003736 [Blastocladiella emersonii ATCC 22665]|nr:hypothetical protein H9P43_003736 [Blastocladiella emersonii ATCC 22665]
MYQSSSLAGFARAHLLRRGFASAAPKKAASAAATAAPTEILVYRTTRPWMPKAAVAGGLGLLLFWANVAYTMNELLNATTAVSLASLDPNAKDAPAVTSTAARLPVFVRRAAGTSEADAAAVAAEASHHIEPPSPLRAKIVAGVAVALGAGSAALAFRFASRMVSEIRYDRTARAVILRHGILGDKTLRVPQKSVVTRQTVSDMVLKGSPVMFVKRTPSEEVAAGFMLDKKGDFPNDGKLIDSLFYIPLKK